MWNQVIGLGVAGNFAGHLEQAGESADFVDVVVADQNAPKGIFPFYLPGGSAEGLGAAALYQMPISPTASASTASTKITRSSPRWRSCVR